MGKQSSLTSLAPMTSNSFPSNAQATTLVAQKLADREWPRARPWSCGSHPLVPAARSPTAGELMQSDAKLLGAGHEEEGASDSRREGSGWGRT